METAHYVLLESRGVVTVAGADHRTFLQGLISNDVRRVDESRVVYAAFLTPQGKYLHDFFVVALDGETVALECEASRSGDLVRRLRPYRLRSKVAIEDRSADWAAAAVFGAGAAEALGLAAADPGAATSFAGGVAYVDPRLAAAGARAILPRADAAARLEAAGLTAAPASAYDRHRIALGLADGSRDLEVERSILLECGFDELHGVDWDKGCFLGQELTARTKYRALIRKRLIPLSVEGPLPPPGTPVLRDGSEVGEIRSGIGDLALAMLRLEALSEVDAEAGSDAGLTAAGSRVRPRLPSWLSV
ncbi:MAG: folate-binding protein YgfZ [Rhodospirillales bacterium]|nr:folate-binding protein YgfZ [Rhodospirillales bacterium]